jgi:uncharacterized protein (DUF1778 family)
MPKAHKRSARIEARIAPDALAVVKRAAELQGRSVSDFVVAAAQEAAHQTIDENHLIRLSIEDQQRFVDLLLNPPPLTPAMKRAKAANSRLIRESRYWQGRPLSRLSVPNTTGSHFPAAWKHLIGIFKSR